MDPATHAFYDDHAAELARRYDAAPDGVSGLFGQAFEGRTTVLDVGCGSGRDVRRLVKLGFDARGVDASAAMIDQGPAPPPARKAWRKTASPSPPCLN
jgi:SAM-dependent methyltransferase